MQSKKNPFLLNTKIRMVSNEKKAVALKQIIIHDVDYLNGGKVALHDFLSRLEVTMLYHLASEVELILNYEGPKPRKRTDFEWVIRDYLVAYFEKDVSLHIIAQRMVQDAREMIDELEEERIVWITTNTTNRKMYFAEISKNPQLVLKPTSPKGVSVLKGSPQKTSPNRSPRKRSPRKLATTVPKSQPRASRQLATAAGFVL